jgi:hypothetical protein
MINNDDSTLPKVYLEIMATGSFAASDGNRGKHYAFLNRKFEVGNNEENQHL